MEQRWTASSFQKCLVPDILALPPAHGQDQCETSWGTELEEGRKLLVLGFLSDLRASIQLEFELSWAGCWCDSATTLHALRRKLAARKVVSM